MKKKYFFTAFSLFLFCLCCKQKAMPPSAELINEMQLKRGPVIACGAAGNQFGSGIFEVTCAASVRDSFELAVHLLHSFEYDEAEKMFASVIGQDPACAMAYWGVAMSNFHPLWTPPAEAELRKGVKAISLAQSLPTSKRETGYINAIAAFYKDWEKDNHRIRCQRFERAMERLAADYPEDKEATIFYALSLDAAADPTDTAFSKQIKAGKILERLYPAQPDHPGIIHYLIHSYDYPGLAEKGLTAAKKYALIAPSSAHALHMPSHIFTRLGMWKECIQSNLESISAAKCYATQMNMKGPWDEEFHGMDYLVYAYLQQGANDSAKKQWDYLTTIKESYPVNFKVAYAFAAIPSRFLLENKLWAAAAKLTPLPAGFPWSEFPWQKANIYFTRLLGAVHIGDDTTATAALDSLNMLREQLFSEKDSYKANQVAIQVKTGEAWINMLKGHNNEALKIMRSAADMEDKTEKHPVSPGEVIPARELLGDMLIQMNKPAEALLAFEQDLTRHPNRFNGLYGAALAAEKAHDTGKAKTYYEQLLKVVGTTRSGRAEVSKAKQYLAATAVR